MISFFCETGVKDDDAIFKKPREIVHKNTRLDRDPFSKALNKSQIQQAAALNAQVSVLLSYCHWWWKNCPHVDLFCLDWWVLIDVCFFSLQFKQGKVGPDGKELIPHESPTVNGYGYEATPSPAPGINLQFFFFFLMTVAWNVASFLNWCTTFQCCHSNCIQALLRISMCNRTL